MQYPGAGNSNHFNDRRNGGYHAPQGRREDLPKVPHGPGPGSGHISGYTPGQSAFPRRPQADHSRTEDTVRIPRVVEHPVMKQPSGFLMQTEQQEQDGKKDKVKKDNGPGERLFGYAMGTVAGSFGVSVFGLLCLKTFLIIKDWLGL